MRSRLVPGVALVLAAGMVMAGQPESVVVSVEGKEAVSFKPAAAPYTTGGPSVSVPVTMLRGNSAKTMTADGRETTGIELIGWREGEATRVMVFLLVLPEKSSAEVDVDLTPVRRDFDTFSLEDGATVLVGKMKALGLKPLTIKAPTAR